VAKDNSPAQLKPRKDMVIADGQQIKLGEVTITLYVTPGHTPGTLSMIIEALTNRQSVASDEERHVAALWGGVEPSLGQHGVRYYADGQAMMKAHVASIRRFMDSAAKAGADVVLPTTVMDANIPEKIRAWRLMNPDMSGNSQVDVISVMAEVVKLQGQPHPFVNKEAVGRYHRILLECYEAQLAWRIGS
jgi:metallo-beta-lactamase class B